MSQKIRLIFKDYSLNLVYTSIMLKRKNINHKNMIIVEGNIDNDFFLKVNNNPDNYFICLQEFKKNQNATFRRSSNEDYIRFNKDEIVEIMNKSDIPELQQKNIYAIVDRDFDKQVLTADTPPYVVFSDSSHDLETMMLQTSNDEALKNIKEIKWFNVDLKKVYYQAYQLALIKEVWSLDYKINNPLDYLKCFKEECLNLNAFFNLILPNNTHKKMNFVTFKNRCKSFLNEDGNFELSFEEFKEKMPADFYRKVNGHDICNLCLCELKKYINVEDYKNKKMEGLLIKYYEVENFKKSTLYKSMHKKNLL